MNRLWIGVGFLCVLLLAGILITFGFQRIHEPLAETLESAAEAALEEDWQKASALAQQAQKEWKTTQNFVATMIDHAQLEQMEAQFSQLTVHDYERNREAFASLCVFMAVQIRAMGDTQAIYWWSIL